jgi:hypothetical protein
MTNLRYKGGCVKRNSRDMNLPSPFLLPAFRLSKYSINLQLQMFYHVLCCLIFVCCCFIAWQLHGIRQSVWSIIAVNKGRIMSGIIWLVRQFKCDILEEHIAPIFKVEDIPKQVGSFILGLLLYCEDGSDIFF